MQRLPVGARRHKGTFDLYSQFIGHIAEGFQLFHMFADAFQESEI